MTLGALAMTADADDATEAFEAALALGAADRFPFDAARIRLAYGIQLRRLHQPARAREVLAMATRTFEVLGAQPGSIVRTGNCVSAPNVPG